MVGMRLPVGVGVAKDASDYLSASQLLHKGANPYNWHAVWEDKRRILGLGENTRGKQLARVAEPPLLFWAMEPLIGRPFGLVCLAFEIVFGLAAAVGLTALLRSFGWKWPVGALLVGLVLPPVSYYVNIANLGVVVFAFLAVGLLLARRYPLAAGLALSMSICKPQLALPMAGLVMLFHSSSRIRAMGGFVLGTVAILGASALATGPRTLIWWLQAFHSFTDTLRAQTMYASLNALYEPYLPARASMLLAIALLLAAAIVTLLALRRYWNEGPVSVRTIAWLWLLWFAASPYDHYYDYIFLAPVVLAFFPRTRPADGLRAWIVLYAVTVAGFLEMLLPQTLVGPLLLFAVLGASLLPFPVRSGARDTVAPARRYQTSA